jgi:putative ABC transport system permease protein
MSTLILAWKSLLNRRVTVLLTVGAIALAVAMLLGVERLRHETRTGFTNTISGTDLIVGARTSPVQLLLYAVFRLGDPTNNISWQSYQEIAAHPRVTWTVPLSLGDSHRGYRVLGTTADYFRHYRYAGGRPLELGTGRLFADLYETVLGAEVAERLGYQPGRQIVIAHGAGDVSFVRHDDKPFTVVGILQRTGTPVDRTVHVRLDAIEALHLGWESGVPLPGRTVAAEAARAADLTPKTITAFLVGVNAKISTFQLQRAINEHRGEPLTAILPGVALNQLWEIVGLAEEALLLISWFVVLVGLLGMLAVLLANQEGRRREMSILRAVGARPLHLFTLVVGEAMLLTLMGAALGVVLLYLLLLGGRPLIAGQFGLFIGLAGLSLRELGYLGAVIGAGLLGGLIPALLAYRRSLADGITLRL